MEIKLNVSIGATLQVKNARGEWDWIKPEVGAEISMPWGEFNAIGDLQHQFTNMWDNVVGPQFRNVVAELIAEQIPKEEDLPEVSDGIDATETTIQDEVDEY